MGQAPTKRSLQEFIEWESLQPDKHEFHRGEVFAMADARRVEGLVSINIASSLNTRLKGSPCQVFANSMKIGIGSDTILYPDVFVTCDASDLCTELVFTAPTLVDPDMREVQVFRRGADGLFTLHDLSGCERIPLTSLACELLATEVFDGVEPAAGQQGVLPI